MPTAREDMKRLAVAVARTEPQYCTQAPYNASERYPEYDPAFSVNSASNPAYGGVRDALYLLGLDHKNYGTPHWNPLGDVIQPGQTVVVKPNFVLSDHYRGGNLYAIITHPSVLRAVIDYAYKALDGEGVLIIADTPQMDCDFEELLDRTRLRSIQELYWNKLRFRIEIRDLRTFWFKYRDENYVASQEHRHPLPGDPLGSVWVNLGDRSAFSAVSRRNFYGADYSRQETMAHHSEGRHEYELSRTILNADVILTVPKLKVHKKVGVTLNAKGFVGTVTNKNSLIHYSLGTADKGGDQAPPDVLKGASGFIVRAQRFLSDAFLARGGARGNALFRVFYTPYRKLLKPLLKKTTEKILLFDGGNWHGNDTAWRMVSDLNRIIIHADTLGALREEPQRKIFSIVDGIIGGEGNGPLFPDERPCGVILAGFNHLAVDIVATRLMGLDWRKLLWVKDLLTRGNLDLSLHDVNAITTTSDDPRFQNLLHSTDRFFAFRPHPGWVGHLEYHP